MIRPSYRASGPVLCSRSDFGLRMFPLPRSRFPAAPRLAIGFSSTLFLLAAAHGSEPEFETEVWPILETHCMECHGEKQTYSNLRLDSPAAIRRGGELGEVLVPGDPESSEIYRRTALPADDLDFMPVDNEPLNEEELERLRDWIAAGADFGPWSGP